MGQHPAHHVAAVNSEGHVEVVTGPFLRAQPLGDLPRPDLIRAGRQQLRLLVVGVPQWIAAFFGSVLFTQQARHRAHAAERLAFVQESGIDFARRLSDEPI